jgi:uncharacterized protein YrzB (UPF0473 family)
VHTNKEDRDIMKQESGVRTMDLEKDESIILTDEEGQEHEFNLVDVITVDDQEYAILQPIDEDEAIILKFAIDENGDEVLNDIEDDEEWEKVADVWKEILEEEEENGE